MRQHLILFVIILKPIMPQYMRRGFCVAHFVFIFLNSSAGYYRNGCELVLLVDVEILRSKG